MTGAKSALEVKNNMTFLDLTVNQIEHLNTTNKVHVPLILMTSFNIHEDTLRNTPTNHDLQLIEIPTYLEGDFVGLPKAG